jgi:peptidoglycan/xylan/chitin deacetylase (PgdA/CDA1 family)
MTRFPILLLGGAVCLAGCASVPSEQTGDPAPRVAITMDDLPVHGPLPEGETRRGVAERIVAAFRAAGVPEVYGFVNGAEVEGDAELESVLSTWVAAGYPLGNHTWSHRNLNQVSVEEFEEEIARNEAVLQRFGGAGDWRWLRYPYLAEGSDPAKRGAIRAALTQRGYRIAAVTTSFADYEWNDAYLRCQVKGDPQAMAALEEAYLEAVEESIERSRSLSRSLYGRDVPYVLLTHISPFNARMMPRVLEVYRRAGFEFTTLEEAHSDSIYRADVDPSQPAGATDLAARARARELPVPRGTNRGQMLAAACR